MLFRMNNLRVGLESRRTLEEAAARQLGIVPQKIRRVTRRVSPLSIICSLIWS